LTIETVRDVELGARVADRRIGAREGEPRFDELVVPEKREPIVERLLVDGVGADDGRQSAGDLADGLRLAGKEPTNQPGLGRDEPQAHRTRGRVTHHSDRDTFRKVLWDS